MIPLRGHLDYITQIYFYEPTNSIFSSDVKGNLFTWRKSEDEDDEEFEKVHITSHNLEITEFRILDSSNLKSRFNCIGIIVIFSSNMFECFKIIKEFSFLRIFKYEPKLKEIHQIEISGDHAFLAADLHNKDRIRENSYIECFNMFKEEQIKCFHISYPYSIIKQISEEAEFLKEFNIKKIFNTNCKAKSILVKNDKIFIILNYDVQENLLVLFYKSTILHNFFIYSVKNPNFSEKKLISDNYLINIESYKNFIMVIGINSYYNVYLISEIDNEIKFKLSNKESILNYSSVLYNNTFWNSLTINNHFWKILNNNSFIIGLNNSEYKIIRISPSNNIYFENFPFVIDPTLCKINDIHYDNYKYAIAFSDNTIKIYSSLDNSFWYSLFGGSMNVIPKSFVSHPILKGFSNLIVSKYSIIASLGNLVRIYNFN